MAKDYKNMYRHEFTENVRLTNQLWEAVRIAQEANDDCVIWAIKLDESRLATQRVIEAWTNEGPVPGYHRQMKERLDAYWPTLARAIENLILVNGERNG